VRIYIASPYTIGDPQANVDRANDVANILLDLGQYPYCPLMSHYLHRRNPRPHAEWLKIDKVWVAQCDVVLRLPGESTGADEEVEEAKKLGIPVVGLEELLEMIKTGGPPVEVKAVFGFLPWWDETGQYGPNWGRKAAMRIAYEAAERRSPRAAVIVTGGRLSDADVAKIEAAMRTQPATLLRQLASGVEALDDSVPHSRIQVRGYWDAEGVETFKQNMEETFRLIVQIHEGVGDPDYPYLTKTDRIYVEDMGE